MHWVNKGPQPDGLESVRIRYTSRWVEYYTQRTGTKPQYSRWTDFKGDLERTFYGLCAYCESTCSGEVDHFRPKSRFPELVYDWANWLLACHDCNHAKGDKWPTGGYVDPCGTSPNPETVFDFDTLNGRIIPKHGLSSADHLQAQMMIDDLRLNERHHRGKRRISLSLIEMTFSYLVSTQSPELQQVVNGLAARATQYSSVARAWLAERGYLPTV